MKMERYDFAKGSTTDEEIRSAIEKRLDVVSAIRNAMETDDENDSMRLLSLYGMRTRRNAPSWTFS